MDFGAAHSAPADFWGLDYPADKNPGPSPDAAIGATPTTTLVYPGGNLTEREDFSTNTVYSPGEAAKATVTVQDFIATCEALSCQAVMELPMEIDSPATDAGEASYVVNTLGFHPAFFLYGNEPAHWACFGVSWAQLAAGHECNTGNTTIPAFATETAAAISLVTAALGNDTPPAMCLGGSGGQGPAVEAAWIHGLLTNPYDKARCAAFAMHVKPAHSQTVTPTLANFYATLVGPEGLPGDYQNASQVTGGKPLFMTEVGAFTPGSAFTPVFTGTWAMDVLESALVVQAMQNRIPDMGWWAWSTGGPDGLYYHGNTTFYDLYSRLFPQLGATWYASQFEGQDGLYAEATSQGSAWSILVASTNISTPYHMSLAGSGFSTPGCATVATWTSTGNVSQALCALGDGFTVPPQSVVMLTAAKAAPSSYPVSITELGLPVGTAWSATLNGTTETGTAPSIDFTEVNGTYDYSIGSVTGYAPPNPSTGTVVVTGGPVTLTTGFVAVYPVTFSENTLPQGTNWSVTMTGSSSAIILAHSSVGSSSVTRWSDGSSTVRFSVSNGSYSYSIVSPGYPSSGGTLGVNGASPAPATVQFGHPPPSLHLSTYAPESSGPPTREYVILGALVVVAGTVGAVVLLQLRGGGRISGLHRLRWRRGSKGRNPPPPPE